MIFWTTLVASVKYFELEINHFNFKETNTALLLQLVFSFFKSLLKIKVLNNGIWERMYAYLLHKRFFVEKDSSNFKKERDYYLFQTAVLLFKHKWYCVKCSRVLNTTLQFIKTF